MDSHPSPTSRVGITIAALLLLAGASACLWIWGNTRSKPPLAVATLTDGTQLRLIDVQEGSTLALQSPPSFWAPLWNHLPGDLRVRFVSRRPWLGGSMTLSPNTFATSPRSHFLVVQQHPPGGGPAFAPDLRHATVDDPDGRSKTTETVTHFRQCTEPNYPPATVIRFSVLPRHAPLLRIRLSLSDGRDAVLTYRNPRPTPVVSGVAPGPLPLTARSGGAEMTLKQLTVEESGWSGDIVLFAQPEYAVRDGAATTEHFTREDISIEDEEGNIVEHGVPHPDSPFWKVRITLAPGDNHPGSAASTIALPTTLPGSGEERSLAVPAVLGTQGVAYVSVFGSGTYAVEDKSISTAPTIVTTPSTTTQTRSLKHPQFMIGTKSTNWSNAPIYNNFRIAVSHSGGALPLLQSGLRKQADGAHNYDRRTYEFTPMSFKSLNPVPPPAPGTPIVVKFIPIRTNTFEFIIKPPPLPRSVP